MVASNKNNLLEDNVARNKTPPIKEQPSANKPRGNARCKKDTSGPRTSGPCDRIKTEDEPRCCKKDMDFDAQDICCTKQGCCFTKEDRKKETLEFAETEIIEL